MIDAIYVWPDGSFVSANVELPSKDTRWGTKGFRIEVRSSAVWFSMVHDDPRLPSILRPLTLVPPEQKTDLICKILGFALDLGVARPQGGVRSSLVLTERQSDKTMPLVPYPRWVEDVRWEGRYEEAGRYTMRRSGPNGWQSDATNEELFLGHIERLQISPPDFGDTAYWFATCSGQTGDPESLYFHGVVDRLLELELILPISSRRAWEAEHVERGEWRVPDPDGVEVFRLLGEDLPWLWVPEKLQKWLESQP